MGIADIERDLKFIRATMESSSRYTNVPASGYLITGLLGFLGTWGTYIYLGGEKVADMTRIITKDMVILIALWLLVFVAAVGCVALAQAQEMKRRWRKK